MIKEFFDVRAALDEVIQIMSFQVTQKNLYLKTNIDQSVPQFIKSDVKRFKQVLFNLIGNAIKFTFKGGVTVRLSYTKKQLTTSVMDTGLGIEPEAIQKLF
jgi:two-component system, sensor histidine kinase